MSFSSMNVSSVGTEHRASAKIDLWTPDLRLDAVVGVERRALPERNTGRTQHAGDVGIVRPSPRFVVVREANRLVVHDGNHRVLVRAVGTVPFADVPHILSTEQHLGPVPPPVPCVVVPAG